MKQFPNLGNFVISPSFCHLPSINVHKYTLHSAVLLVLLSECTGVPLAALLT